MKNAHRSRRARALVLATAALVAIVPGTACAAQLTATPSNFRSVFAAAQAGDTILLASGDYGTFRGGLKSGEVTIQEQDGASASMAVEFQPAANITLDGLRLRGAEIAGSRTKNITIRNSDFDGYSVVMRGGTGDLTNANVLLDNNRHTNRDVCSGCYAGRIQISERTSEPTGITIQNSYFAGGTMDGIQNGGNGVRILGNEFANLAQGDADVAHTDAIQLYGSKNTVIRGNYFHDVSVAIGGYDGVDHETIEDNVIVMDGTSAYGMQFLSDNGSVIRHNTFAGFSSSGRPCAYNVACGTILLGNKPNDPRSAGTTFKDNILARISVDGMRPDYADEGFNLFTSATGSGSNDLLGRPVYVGGAAPTSYAGFELAAGSAGKGTASDGLDRGVRFASTEPGPGEQRTQGAP